MRTHRNGVGERFDEVCKVDTAVGKRDAGGDGNVAFPPAALPSVSNYNAGNVNTLQARPRRPIASENEPDDVSVFKITGALANDPAAPGHSGDITIDNEGKLPNCGDDDDEGTHARSRRVVDGR